MTHTQGERRQVRTGSVAVVMDELSTISIIAHSFWLCVYLKQLTCVFVCVCRVANKQLLSAQKVKDIFFFFFFFFLFSLSFEKKIK
jgi:phosphate starvation-inducible membrane PsiE